MDWTVLKLLEWTTGYLEKNQIEKSRLESEILLAHVLKLRRLDLYLQFERPVNESELATFKALIKRRITGEPVAYLTGKKEFWSMEFKVTPATLVPRPDTEVLVEAVVRSSVFGDREKPISILDIGTGSGILAIVLAKEFPNSTIDAFDISDAALEIAKQNATTHGVNSQIQFHPLDFLKHEHRTPNTEHLNPNTYDLIVSNPPYIKTEDIKSLPQTVRDFEPKLALNGGNDGLDFYRRIGDVAPNLLKTSGLLALEIGEDQGEAVPKILENAGFKNITLTKDYSGLPRVVVGLV